MSMLDDAKAKAAAPYKAIGGASPAKAEEIDSLVANGKITALAGAMAKLRFIGPQSLTPAQRALVQMPSDNALGSVANTSGVLGAATAAQKPTPQGKTAAAGISALGQPGGGAMETTMPSTGDAKPTGAAGKANAAAAAAMGAKPPATLASGKVAANGGGVSGGVENDNPWSNGEAAQATGDILDNTPGVGAVTKPNYAKNYAGAAGAPAALGNALSPPVQPAPVANSGPTVGTPGQPMPKTGKVPYVLSPEEIVGLQNGQYNNAPQSVSLPAPDNTEKAKHRQALESKRAALTAELAQVEAELAKDGAA